MAAARDYRTSADLLAEFDAPDPRGKDVSTGTFGDFDKDFVDTYKERGLVLMLGAGVSVGDRKPAVVPPWSDLVKAMAKKCRMGAKVFNELKKTHSLPAIVGMLEHTANSRESGSFVETLREEVYRGAGLRGTTLRGAELADRMRELPLSTLRSIATFCTIKYRDQKGRTSYGPNPLVKAVITFNVDTLLQHYANAEYYHRRKYMGKNSRRILRTIERSSAGPRQSISLYHMHGSLEFHQDRIGNLTEEASDALVFTEQEYFDFFSRPMSRFSYTFLFLLRESPCLFIGTSMTDDNIRRLLHYSKSDITQGYAAEIQSLYAAQASTPGEEQKAKKIEREISHARKRLHRHYVILKKQKVTSPGSAQLTKHDQFRAHALYRLGVKVCWIDDHAEVPQILQRLYREVKTTDASVNETMDLSIWDEA